MWARHSPTSVAHVTSHLTISRRRQLRVDRVMRITCETNRVTLYPMGIH